MEPSGDHSKKKFTISAWIWASSPDGGYTQARWCHNKEAARLFKSSTIPPSPHLCQSSFHLLYHSLPLHCHQSHSLSRWPGTWMHPISTSVWEDFPTASASLLLPFAADSREAAGDIRKRSYILLISNQPLSCILHPPCIHQAMTDSLLLQSMPGSTIKLCMILLFASSLGAYVIKTT